MLRTYVYERTYFFLKYDPTLNYRLCYDPLVPHSSCLWSSVKQLDPYGCYIDFPFGEMTANLECRSDTSKKAVISALSSAFMRRAFLKLLVSILASLAKHDEMTIRLPLCPYANHTTTLYVVNIQYYISSPNRLNSNTFNVVQFLRNILLLWFQTSFLRST